MPSCIPKLPTTFLFLFCENQIPNIYITVRKSNRYGSLKKKKKSNRYGNRYTLLLIFFLNIYYYNGSDTHSKKKKNGSDTPYLCLPIFRAILFLLLYIRRD